MKLSRNSRLHTLLLRLGLGLVLALGLAQFVTGCATNDENLSERPWNTPRSWETGLPSGMTEERR